MKHKFSFKIAVAIAVVAAVGGTALYAQDKSAMDKHSLVSPSGIAFADFKGYEDWALVSSARTEEVLKVVIANPTMIKAYKAGIPGNGQPSRMDPKSSSSNGRPRRVRKRNSSWTYPMSSHRHSS